MAEKPADWPRQNFSKPGGRPFLFYVAFGALDGPLKISASKYRVGEMPDDVELMDYGPDRHPEQLNNFREGYLWNELRREDADLAAAIAAQQHCVVLRADLEDQSTLNYFRDTIGLLTYLLDHGCVGIYDPQMIRYWSAPKWRAEAFDPAAAVPRNHVITLYDGDGAGTEWFHTRGMRKFGRPDISVPHTPAKHRDAVIELINRFIEFQAFGGIVEEGREIKVANLPAGMRCSHHGNLEDPDFNNVHVRIDWP